MKIRIYLTGIFFVICVFAEALAFVGKSCEIPENWIAMETEDDSENRAIFDLDASAISIGQPFSFNVSLCGDEKGKPDRLTANAIMPAHQHGMNYIPTVSYLKEANNFEVEGFLFHMPGVWEITVASYRGEDVTHFTKSIMIK
jgi:hypothetical protein